MSKPSDPLPFVPGRRWAARLLVKQCQSPLARPQGCHQNSSLICITLLSYCFLRLNWSRSNSCRRQVLHISSILERFTHALNTH
ncbi:hypothetical protein SORBI_3006G162700 [Sorghum bicolor]|uniref:Uncharacterized protein n=1 Tax=Sorghum bicolor TaxID=4558 RepID=A0A1B6PMA4_SORBI|nr:hypothetical protein SORBI_3006G162700 [Sorghum bicolor]